MNDTASRPPRDARRSAELGAAIRSEWVKLRTVRGWLAGPVLAVLACMVFTFLVGNGTHSGVCTGTGTCRSGHTSVPSGPQGEAVADTYEYLSRALVGDGSVTARVVGLRGLVSTNPTTVAPSVAATRPGLAAWSKAGVLLTTGTGQGHRYAAVVATGGHGVRFQHDYVHDAAGTVGTAASTSPRWVRLTRSGDTVTGSESADGTSWRVLGTARLTGLPHTVRVGLVVTSPVTFLGAAAYPTQATGTFDRVTVDGTPTQGWRPTVVGFGASSFYPTLGAGAVHPTADGFEVTGSGDIAPAVVQGLLGTDTVASSLELGLVVVLMVLAVVAAMFVTTEYRRGLIRTTFAATPARGRVLAAKAVVVAAAGFVTGCLAAAAAAPVGSDLLSANGAYVFPTSAATTAGVVLGCGALVALTAVGVLALGASLRRSAGAVAVGTLVFVLPAMLAPSLGDGARTWLFRATPAAALAVLDVLPRSSVVEYPYTVANGYEPLPAWGGLLVLAAYVAAALVVARAVIARRDA